MSEICKWLHECLDGLPLINYPFELEKLPKNGIYFFYENDEIWGHGGSSLRVTRVGTHKQGNFRSRIKDHYLFDESKMNFEKDKLKPSDRSIFRKNIGRALLNKKKDKYLKMWEIDFTYKEARNSLGHIRDINKEKAIECNITRILRENFSFRFLVIDKQYERMGSQGLESTLIGAIARCNLCETSDSWLGNYSPVDKIRSSGLWQVQHLEANEINEDNKGAILDAIASTKDGVK